MRKALAVALVFSGFGMMVSCSPLSVEKVIYIDHFLAPGSAGNGPILSYRYRESANAEWQFLYNGIEGFQYEQGYQYRLRVRETTVLFPLADASSVEYDLLAILEKAAIAANTQFDIQASRDSIVEKPAGTFFLIEIPISFKDQSTKDQFLAFLSSGTDSFITGTFEHTADLSGYLLNAMP